MAGMAEAAVFFQLLIAAGIFLLAVGFFALFWWKRKKGFETIFWILVVIAGIFVEPWLIFESLSSDDPDEAYWLVRFRIGSIIWSLFVFAAIILIRRWRLKKDAPNES